MNPTPRLRFVERIQIDAKEAILTGSSNARVIRILQQWWAIERAGQITPTGEWRDVPLETEE